MQERGAAKKTHRVAEGQLAVHRLGAHSLVRRCKTDGTLVLRPFRDQQRTDAQVMLGQLGGGYVSGDTLRLQIEVEAGATLWLRGQAGSKIYGGDAQTTVETQVRIEAGASLLAPGEPLTPYAGARYRGRTRLELAVGASLCWWESLTAGRVACGERWQQASFESALEVHREGRLWARDSLFLEPEVDHQVSGFASVVVCGPRFAPQLDALAELSASCALSSVRRLDDGVLIRLGVFEPGQLNSLRDRMFSVL